MGSIHEKYGKNLLTLSLQNQWNNVNKLNNYLFLTSISMQVVFGYI